MTTTATRQEATVEQLMTVELVSVTVDTPLAEVAELLERHHISGLPVLGPDGGLAGVISQTDLLRARAVEDLWASWPGLRARHLMSHPALTVRPETPIDEAARLMEDHGVHRLVVVAAGTHRPVGILSVSDLLHSMAARHG
jgi:CBS domain-containing protein